MSTAFDLKSADTTELINELSRVKARIEDLKIEHGRLSDLAGRIWKKLDQVFGAPDKKTEQVIREIEANMKRSASRIIRDRRFQKRTVEEARIAATDRALAIAEEHFLPSLPVTIVKHIAAQLKAAYGECLPTTARRLGPTK